MKSVKLSIWVVVLAFVPAALGQDSSSKDLTCGVGDSVQPWDDSAAAGGSEQCNDYIVDLSPFTSAWGDNFTIAPLVKSSKAASGFTGSLISAHAISKDYLKDVDFARSTYDLWSAPGFGVNNDPAKNDPGIPVVTSGMTGDQFSVAFAEFATTDAAASYNGVIGAVVNRLPAEPNRLYVNRRVVATNACDDASNVSQIAVGSVDADGNVVYRADDFGLGGGCGLTNAVGNNVYITSMAARSCDDRNVVSGDYPAGEFDAGTTEWIVRSSPTAHNAPGLLPASVTGGAPVYIGSNFDVEYVRGSTFPATADMSHLPAGMTDHRGNLGYTSRNCSLLGSTHGMTGMLSNSADGLRDNIAVWGLDAAGSVTGNLNLVLPAVVTDNATGAINLPGVNEFNNYASQVAFRGGNGQVALGTDQSGNLLVAASADHPEDLGSDWPINYVAVARVNCGDGSTVWTMAGYNDGTIGAVGTGKPILDGPGGAVIGRMVTLDNVTGGIPFGPSISSPMIDSVGNVYFVSAVELFDDMGGSNFNTALLRAVYDEANFAYELDLLLALGGTADTDPTGFYETQPVAGQNSGLTWAVDFLGIVDSNSVSSGTAFSGNISSAAHLGMDPALIAETRDPQALGGLVVSVEIVYDSDMDGDGGDGCGNPFDPPSDDEEYNVLLFIGAGAPSVQGCPGGEFAECGDTDDNGIRDDACAWYACDAGACSSIAKVTQADIGGANGACPIDGACDGNDNFHALNCFSNRDTFGNVGYPCEPSTPSAINVDAGGANGSCILDGVCDGNDNFHALNCFSNQNTQGNQPYPCGCGPQPDAPATAGPSTPRSRTGITVLAPRTAQPGDLVEVEVRFDDALAAVRGYQLHVGVTGGERGTLELVDLGVDARRSDWVFADAPGVWQGFNRSIAQLLVGMNAPEGVPSAAAGYLATFTYRVPKDAAGTFVIDVLHDGSSPNPTERTFLFGENARTIDVSSTTAARITVVDRRTRGKRLGN